MARVTVEDCAKIIPNRFELVALASERARNISTGAPIHVEREDDKNPVISLRELAEGKIDPYKLRESYIQSFQKNLVNEEPEKDDFFAEEFTNEEIISVADLNNDLEEEEDDLGSDLDHDFSNDTDFATDEE